MLIQTLDVDECAMASKNDCSANAECVNTVGSFTCTCKSGFAGDGKNCIGITRWYFFKCYNIKFNMSHWFNSINVT